MVCKTSRCKIAEIMYIYTDFMYYCRTFFCNTFRLLYSWKIIYFPFIDYQIDRTMHVCIYCTNRKTMGYYYFSNVRHFIGFKALSDRTKFSSEAENLFRSKTISFESRKTDFFSVNLSFLKTYFLFDFRNSLTTETFKFIHSTFFFLERKK